MYREDDAVSHGYLQSVMGHGSETFTCTSVPSSCIRPLIKPPSAYQSFSALYASIHPDPEAPAKVPILEDTDGTQLIESLTVARYLDAKYPERPLMPKSPAEVAKVGALCVEVWGPTLVSWMTVNHGQPWECMDRQ